jgi:DNA-binding response OmpR family regulator
MKMQVVILTARGEDIDRVKGLECGADLFLTKPFSPAQLVAHTSEILGVELWGATGRSRDTPLARRRIR